MKLGMNMKRMLFGTVITVGLMICGFVITACQASAADAPAFSKDSGCYDSQFTLTITAGGGCSIYYTTNGDIPTTASTKYNAGITVKNRQGEANQIATAANMEKVIDNGGNAKTPDNTIAKCTVIRAIAVNDSDAEDVSSVITKTYFVGTNFSTKYKNAAVISLTTDNDNLFGDKKGIYCKGDVYKENASLNETYVAASQWWKIIGNYTQKGKDWERPAHMDFFENDGSVGFATDLGIRGHGGASRMYAQKSFNIYIKKKYGGESLLEYDLFKGEKNGNGSGTVTQFDKFVLRNGGNDTEYTKAADALNQSRVRDRAIATQACRPCVVFLNGEYWGVYNIQEKYSDTYLSTEYGVNPENIVSYKDGELEEGNDEDGSIYQSFQDLGKLDMTKDENYKKFTDAVDVQSFMDYFASEMFFGNYDWPADENGVMKNMQIWKTVAKEDGNEYADTKWRYMLFDTEYSFGLYGSSISNILTWAKKDPVFSAVCANATFQKEFATACNDIMNKNFAVADVNAAWQQYYDLYQPLMGDFYKRFSYGDYAFKSNMDRIKEGMTSRAATVRKVLSSAFGCKDSTTVRLMSSTAPTMNLNTLSVSLGSASEYPSCKAGNWSGVYYKKYPITVTAPEVSGKKFVKWIVTTGVSLPNLDTGKEEFETLATSTEKTATFELTQSGKSVNIEAVYEAETPAPTAAPTIAPTVAPTPVPTAAPTVAPSKKVTVGKVAIKSATLKKKKLTIKWKKVSGAKGYQVQAATNKKMTKGKKSFTVKGTSKSIKKLRKKTYYVRVRAYKVNGGKKIYGKWSAVKKVK